MKKLLTLINKNFRLIIRSKGSAIMIVLGPLLLIILMGAAFNTASIYGIRVGVHSESYSPLSEAIIQELNHDDYATEKIDSEKACIDGVRNGIFHVCAIFPKDLKVSEGGQIKFYVDNTKTNLVYLVTETISSQIGEKSQDLSFQLTKGVVDTLNDIESEIKDKEALIKEIKSINQEDSAILEKIAKDLTSMTLDYKMSDIPLNSLQPQVVEGSEGIFKAVENKIEKILDDNSKASSARKRALENIQTVSQNTESIIFTSSQIEKTFNNIKLDISSVKETGVSNIVSPISSDIQPITTEKTHLNFIFPTLLMMIIMFVSMLLTSTLEIRERTSKVYFKNFITPTSDILFTISNYLTNLIIISIQTTLLLGAAAYFFYENINTVFPLLLPALIIIISIFLLLGIILGSLFRSEETNTITTISIGFIMIFFSSAILPIETLPTIIKSIANYNPFFISESLLNQIILFQAPLNIVKNQFITLGSYLLGLIILTGIVKKITKGRE